jgi:hypothetical protein
MQDADSQWLQANERLITGSETSEKGLYVNIFLRWTDHPFSIMQAALQALQFTHLL